MTDDTRPRDAAPNKPSRPAAARGGLPSWDARAAESPAPARAEAVAPNAAPVSRELDAPLPEPRTSAAARDAASPSVGAAPKPDLAAATFASRMGALAGRVGEAGRTARRGLGRCTAVWTQRTGPVLARWRDGAGVGARRIAGTVPALLRGLRRPSLPRPRWRHFFGALALLVLAGVGYLAYAVATLPLNGGLQVEASPSALVLEAEGGEVFATRGTFKGDKLTSADLPPHLAQAVVAVEDRRFYHHWGIDLRGTLRAAWRNAQAGGTREGGSTLTQQLARMMFLSSDRHLKRKVQEAALALWLEHQLSKEEILLRYLNTAYFGAGSYGVDAAAKRYFGKTAKDLTVAEAAMLAGLVRAPSQLAPTRNLEGAKERAEVVLQAMTETGAVTADQAAAARAQPVSLRTPPETPPGANYFVDVVANDARRLLGNASGDLTLRTTLDMDLQRLAEGVVARRLETEGDKRKASQGALVALSADGALLALVGGRDYEASQFNRATQAKRQPGSLFKLFVYLTAFQKGYTPQSTLVDRPTQIGDWEPQNANGRFRGRVDLRTAFAQSLNTVAAQLGEEVGIPAVIETAKRLGVQSDLPAVPSLALGSAEVTLMEMTRAYAAVGAGTAAIEPYTVRAIRGSAGQPSLYTRPGTPPDPRANGLGESGVLMVDLLQAVVRDGTGKAARIPNVPVAGKTGTTQDYRDAWFVGITPDLVVGVWVGNDDNAPMDKVVGGDLPATIWRDFVTRAAPLLAKKRQPPTAAQASLPPPPPATTGAVPPPARDARALRGSADVVDTGTLEIRGRTVRLLGVDGERGRFSRQLGRFLRGREVACEPIPEDGRTARCQVEGEDLSEVILRAGGARAMADAPPELLAAEDEARQSRLGIWRRSR